MSTAGCASSMPVTPPETNKDTKPRANSIAVVKRICPRHKVASQLNVLMADGTATAMVEMEKAMLE